MFKNIFTRYIFSKILKCSTLCKNLPSSIQIFAFRYGNFLENYRWHTNLPSTDASNIFNSRLLRICIPKYHLKKSLLVADTNTCKLWPYVCPFHHFLLISSRRHLFLRGRQKLFTFHQERCILMTCLTASACRVLKTTFPSSFAALEK